MKYSSSPRPERSRRSWLLLEKLPFLLLAIASSVVTFLVQRSGGAMMEVTHWPVGMRVGNALAAYVAYLWKMLWPVDLAVLYPLRPGLPLGLVLGSAVVLLIITAVVVWRARRQPYLAVGWFWYLGTLVPVIGLVTVGSARMADRYTYIPLIGVFVLLVWAVGEWVERWRWGRAVAGGVAVVVLGACGVATARQVAVWRNSMTLFEHALAAGEARAGAHNGLGLALADQGKTTAAIAHYQEALRLQPEDAGSHNNYGNLLAKLGRLPEAITHCREALRLKPDYPEAHNNYGNMLNQQGHTAAAIAQFQEALRLKPDSAKPLNNLSWLLATSPDEQVRNGVEAVKLAKRAGALVGDNDPSLLDTLAAAYAEAGRFAEAVKAAEQALALAQAGTDKALAGQIESRLQLYRQGKPYREK